MRRAILVALCAGQMWAVSYTSTKSGNWSDSSVWTPAGVPGNGDTVSIANGHTVTVDQNVTVGTSVNAYYSYVHSITVTGGSGYTSCTSATFSGGTPNYSGLPQYLWNGTTGASCRVVDGAVYTELLAPRAWYAVSSAAPTVSITAAGGSGASVAVVWAQGSGVAAINLNASGALTVASGVTLTVRGTILYTSGSSYTTNGLTMQPGANLVFDSSQAADIAGCTDTPGSAACKPIYSYGPNGNNGYRAFVASCTAAARCSISANASGNVGSIGHHGTVYANPVTLNYVDLTRIGDAITAAVGGYGNTSGSVTSISVTNSTFTACGPIYSTAAGGAMNFTLSNTTFSGSAGRANLEVDFGSAPTTGVSVVSGNVFDKPPFPCVGTGSKRQLGLTMTDNYSAERWCTTGNATQWAAFARNFVRSVATNTSSSADLTISGPVTDNYLWADFDVSNWHTTSVSGNLTSSVTMEGNVVGVSGSATGDSGEAFIAVGGTYSSATTHYVRNNLILPAASGYSFAELISGSHRDNMTVNITHNTWFGGFYGASSPGFPMLMFEELAGNNATGDYPVFASNIAWNPMLSGFSTVYLPLARSIRTTSIPQDINTPSGSDYNWTWNATATNPSCSGCTNQGNGYISNYSVTPGAHDGSGDPRFVDWQRTVELFSSKYLGYSPAWHPEGENWSEWSSSGTYAYGDFVSSSDAGTYWGLTINYRCIHAGGCTGALKPGVIGTAWRTYWEWDSLYRMRKSLGANYTVFPVDGGIHASRPASCTESNNNIICVMMAWIRRGYTPRNMKLFRAGHDGLDIGAVSMSKPGVLAAMEY